MPITIKQFKVIVIRVRRYEVTDSEKLLELFNETIRTVNSRDYNEQQIEAWAPRKRNIQEWIASSRNKDVFIAEDVNKTLGFGEIGPDGHIDRFYIDHTSTGKGVGKMIFNSIEECAVERKLNRLFVEASTTAKPFFQKMGFSEIEKQTVILREVAFTNYRMEKLL